MAIKKIYYNKLVRDKIPEIIKSKDAKAKFRKLTSKQFKKYLLLKVEEEASALQTIKSKEEITNELADVIEVIEEIKKFMKISEKEINIEIKKNMDKKGGFNKRLFLIWSEDTGYKTNEKRNAK
ncbi:MAG: nucleoside triphosphate pyrophosphohydrolase [Candidatus Woesebacteria bacterium]|nr:nucleoside triphosphate pyrophosphohydrolase [Candidatus Woesebacteria bacterium]